MFVTFAIMSWLAVGMLATAWLEEEDGDGNG